MVHEEVRAVGGSVLTPILIGAAINAALFFIMLYVFKRNIRQSTVITFIAAVLVLISSFIVAGWQGMGIGIISFGMFICSIILVIVGYIPFKK